MNRTTYQKQLRQFNPGKYSQAQGFGYLFVAIGGIAILGGIAYFLMQ